MRISVNKIKIFFKSLWFHIWAGFPKSTKQQILERLSICTSCDRFDIINSECKECGCNINEKRIFLNKLAWADQECPLGKWNKLV